MKNRGSWLFPLGGAALLFLTSLLVHPGLPLGTLRAQAPCAPPLANAIVAENCLPGTPSGDWDVSGAGDPSIQGFATDISVNQGETVFFKIATDANDYRLEIYRMGYYQGNGARLVATIEPLLKPSPQEACLEDVATGLVDCGNWLVSAEWSVPSDATSGIYFAKLVREEGPQGASHVVFIVRDDDGESDLLFQTSDTTWQAYNSYGGNSLYVGSPAGRAYKVSYNRPFVTRGGPREDWVFNAEYPMVRWLERNGYDVSYFAGVDSDRSGSEIQEHRVFLSVGHDEYWSASQRANVEAARDAGVHLGFFSGNEIFWKTRWEPSIDGFSTPHRTLVTYKETHANAKIDPLPNVWTGTWRDPRFSPPADGGRPENALSGTIFTVNGYRSDSIVVPAEYAPLRFWRHTTVADLLPGQSVTFAPGTLGYEWDEDLDNGHRPPGSIRLSSATVEVNGNYLQDFGSTYGNGTATHHLTLHKHVSGALVFGAGTVHWSWGLDPIHEFAGPDADLRLQQATVNLFADMGVSPATPMANLVVDSGSADATAPTSAIESPVSGATASSGSPVTVSGTAVDTDGEVGAVEVSVDGGLTWHAATGRDAWSFLWTPAAQGVATLMSRAVDDSGNLEVPSSSVTVNVGPPAPPSCPCTIWSSSTTPAVVDANDPGAVELGVKFRSDVGGFITGLRFYKAAANTGTHTGRLWTSTNTLLGTLTFTGETASGWQESSFSAPIAISADTTYIASYHAPSGHYSVNGGYFASSGTDNPPLHALQSGVDGPNGVFQYGSGGIFPTNTFNSANYWVDVVLNGETGPDSTPPGVTAISPGNGANGAGTTTNVTATFNEPMDVASIGSATFELRDLSSNLVPASVTYSQVDRKATLHPTSLLAPLTTYVATVKGGVAGVEDLAGNALADDVTWSFTTSAPPPPPPDEGPGGPILVIASAANPFTRYYGEILRNEGLNAFVVTDISLVTPTVLAAHDVVILGEMPLTPSQVTLLSNWVSAGGNLIAMRPDKQLAGLLGLTDAAGTLSNGYLLVNTGSGPGSGLVSETIQFHDVADLYVLSGASSVSTLYSNATLPTANPAVTLRSVGAAGGQAAAFTFDLARSVVYTRQGNPAWEGQERDGTAPVRSDDMFFGAAAGDAQPDWIDLNKVAIPQADEQQRLLANLLLHMTLDRKPLPRFWYFPRGEKAVVVLTSDEHGGSGTVGRLQNLVAASPVGCSVDAWECVRGSAYIYESTLISDAQALSFHGAGFEIGVHASTNCANWTPSSLANDLASQQAAMATKLPSIPLQSSHRVHCVAWSDWATLPKVEKSLGIRFNTTYYYWPPGWVQNRPGFFTGSGMPMRFADLDGTMVDVYQAATQMTDESEQLYPFTINTLLDRALGPQGYYGAFTGNMHSDSEGSGGSDDIVASALARGVPVVSGRQMLEWLDGRNASTFGSLAWNGTSLSFTISQGAGANGLVAMVPVTSAVGALTGITFEGNPIAFTTEAVKGVGYAHFPAAAGAYVATYAVDGTPPVISGLTATPGTNGTSATVTWSTTEPASSRVDYGTSPAALDLNAASATLAQSHSLVLGGLAPSTTYYYRATSADAALNASTSPAPPDAPASFTTPATPTIFVDTTSVDFGAGITGTCRVVEHDGDGEVVLSPTEGSEFSGTALPPGWSSVPWADGGGSTVGSGALTVDAALAQVSTFHPAGRSLEFVATFSGQAAQHAGFGIDFNNFGWAIFSTGTGGNLLARTATSGGVVVPDTSLGATLLGSPHRFRIDWTPTGVAFFVDGQQVAFHSVAITDPLRPLVSDLNLGGGSVAVDWLQMSPFQSPCTFASRVFDAGGVATWGTLSWTRSGEAVGLAVRTGNTPTPDGTWSSFAPIPASGGAIGGASRYIQYRADLDATNPDVTPILLDVTIGFTSGVDGTPPTITDRTPAPGATEVALDSNVTVQFSEPMSPATIHVSTLRLRAVGDLVDVPAQVTYAGATATLNPDSPLAAGTEYQVTVSGSVSDVAGNPLGADAVWTFTSAATVSTKDTTVADFQQGAGCAIVAHTGDGEVTLGPMPESTEFAGPGLPSSWASFPWSAGGASQVTGGALVVDGARANTTPGPGFGPGRSLEFVATFAAAAFQHVGFGGGNDVAPGEIFNTSPWAIFSTGTTGTELQARTWNGVAQQNVAIPGSLLGAPHRYRIDWLPTQVDFYVDGNLVSSHSVSLAGSMRPAASDAVVGSATLSVDWIVLTPYSTECVFESRVFDAGAAAAWDSVAWTGATPPNTELVLSVRTGDTATPDGSWSNYVPLAGSPAALGVAARYIRYRADLSTTDANTTPELRDVTLSYTLTKSLTVTQPANGKVTGSDINCGLGATGCSKTYPYNTPVTLTATPDTGYSFSGWTGDCTGTGGCNLQMTTNHTVGATFTIQSYTLTVTQPAHGKVTGAGIDCGLGATLCSESYPYNTAVALTATPETGYSFSGWTGDCTGMGGCNLQMTTNHTVGATFTIQSYTLTVTQPAHGKVTGTGIDCGLGATLCSESYPYNTAVALTATPETGYSFSGWTGDCTGMGGCNLQMTTNHTVGATFTIQSYTLTVTQPAHGKVTGTGIDCGLGATLCSESYPYNTAVALTATPETGYSFSGWTGDCTGMGGCNLQMTTNHTVGASFTIQSYTLTVSKSGSGAGTVTSNPPGISCGGDCSEAFTHGMVVTLTPTAEPGSAFVGWSGACSGTGPCQVTMDAAKGANATFDLSGVTPVILEKRVTTGSDDVEERAANGKMDLNSTDLDLVTDDGTTLQVVGLRFRSVTIPPTATITNAWVQFRAQETDSNTPSATLSIRGQAADNAPAFTSSNYNVSQRPRTQATVTWSPPAWTEDAAGAAQRTSNLALLIQEIVARPGWASGNALVLVVSGQGQREADCYEASASAAPLLHVEYVDTGNRAPTVSAGPDLMVVIPAAATLDGTVTDDGKPLPPTLTVAWSEVSGPGDVTFANPAAIDTTATFSAAGTYLLRLTASDGALASTDDVEVQVKEAGTVVLERRIAAGSDDAEQRGSSMSLTSGDLQMVKDGSTTQTVGLRFTALAVPPGRTITSAWLQFQADETSTEATTLTIKGHAADNAGTFTTSSNNISSRPKTSAAATWAPPAWSTVGEAGPAQRSVDLKTVLQEIVNRTGWRSGNAVAFIITGSGRRVAESYEGSQTGAPMLHVEYR